MHFYLFQLYPPILWMGLGYVVSDKCALDKITYMLVIMNCMHLGEPTTIGKYCHVSNIAFIRKITRLYEWRGVGIYKFIR